MEDCSYDVPLGTDGISIEPSWASEALGFEVRSARLVKGGSLGGMVGTIRIMEVEIATGQDGSSSATARYAIKIGTAPAISSSSYGLVREANFYSELAPELGDLVPRCPLARGDRSTGRKILVMEDLSSGTVSGDLLGTAHPHTWARKEEVLATTEAGPGPERVIEETFAAVARLHAKFWCHESLKGAEWIAGRGDEGDLESWLSSMKRSRDLWRGQREGVDGISMKPELVEIMDAAMSKISLESYKGRFQGDMVYTLCQGDFHPFNAMWMDGRIVLYDWEMVSIGSPGQELGQYMMNIDINIRRNSEKKLVKSYYDKLIESGVKASDLSFEDLWGEYIRGGAGKWIWLLPVLIAFCPKPMAQWFCDQMMAFFEDHRLTKENAPDPRM